MEGDENSSISQALASVAVDNQWQNSKERPWILLIHNGRTFIAEEAFDLFAF